MADELRPGYELYFAYGSKVPEVFRHLLESPGPSRIARERPMDLLPFVHMYQFYYYLIWSCFVIVEAIRGVVFRLSLGRRGLGSRVSGLVDWDWVSLTGIGIVVIF